MTAEAAVSIKTQLDRDTIMVGETASLTISVEGGSPRSIESFPSNNGLSIQYRGTSQNTTIVDGNVTSRNILNFVVSAAQTGQFTIPSVKVLVDGAQYPTRALTINVTKSDVPGGNRYAFLKLNAPRQQIYVGELVPVEVQLYVTEAENVQPPQLKGDGFVINKQTEGARAQTQSGNMIYNVLTFKMSVSAAKAGHLTLGPAESSLVLRLRAQPDPNDLFGMFGRYQRRQVTIASPTLDMTVLPVPATNAPADFSGAIGAFSWQVSASPNTLSAGDPITLKIVISGRGNFDTVKLPDFNWPDFKAYSPNATLSADDPLGFSGTKTIEQVVVPQSGSVREIPAFSFAFFDPERKQFARLSQGAIPLTVRASAAGQAVPTVVAGQGAEPDEPQSRTDIVHIKSDPGASVGSIAPLIMKPWFLTLQALPLLGFIGISFWRKRQDDLANNPRLRRKLEVQRTVSDGLLQLRQLAAGQQTDEFFASVFRLLQEQLGERLDLPSSAITEAVVDERLAQRGASEELMGRVHELFLVCNQVRYAPVRTNEELQAVASKLENAVRELQQLPD